MNNELKLVQRISHKNINREKYQRCILNAINYRIYAEDWYLDIVTENRWDCLVYNDYEAVMPLPYRKKFLIKYIAQPMFCQQLGVFYAQEIPKEIFTIFEKKLHKNITRAYHFNEENTESYQPKGIYRNNFVLDISGEYQEIFSSFSKNRKYDLKNKSDVKTSEDIDINTINQFFEKKYNHLKINNKILENLIITASKKNKISQKSIVNFNKTIASVLFLRNSKRIIYLISLRKKDTKSSKEISILINEIIKRQEFDLLDFEGSEIQGIANFYKSFGAEKKHYTLYRNFI